LLSAFSVPAQEIRHEALAVNIEIAVRVFQGKNFVDNLALQDFEVYEDGVPQDIAAVYLIRNTAISREEKTESAPPELDRPPTQRHFVLAFEVINWMPRIRDSLEYFFYNILQKEDSLIITTPLKTYRLTPAALERKFKSQILNELTELLRRDIVNGNREYKNLIRDLRTFDLMVDPGYFPTEQAKKDLFTKIRDYKYFDEKKFQVFADALKDLDGQKHVFFFYQKEEIPYPKDMDAFFELTELTARDSIFDVDRIKRLFSDSTITTYFLFLTKQIESMSDVEIFNPDIDRLPLTDQSYAIFKPFHEVTKTSGGITTASADPFPAFKSTAEAARNYYLLYYSPKKYEADGGFRNIEVRIKSGKYRIYHRAGYIAD
jgi:hypothetical protein